jgi:hypothetical protein
VKWSSGSRGGSSPVLAVDYRTHDPPARGNGTSSGMGDGEGAGSGCTGEIREPPIDIPVVYTPTKYLHIEQFDIHVLATPSKKRWDSTHVQRMSIPSTETTTTRRPRSMSRGQPRSGSQALPTRNGSGRQRVALCASGFSRVSEWIPPGCLIIGVAASRLQS